MRLDPRLYWSLLGGLLVSVLLTLAALVFIVATLVDGALVLLELVARSLEMEGSP